MKKGRLTDFEKKGRETATDLDVKLKFSIDVCAV